MKLNMKRTVAQATRIRNKLLEHDVKEEPIIKPGAFDLAKAVYLLSPLIGVEFEDFSFKNRKARTIQGKICYPKKKGIFHLIPVDAGLRTGLTFELPRLAVYLAKIGYITFSVNSQAEAMGEKGLEYIDAMYYLRQKYNFISNKSATLGISFGGAAVALKIATEQIGVKDHGIKCAVAAAAYTNLFYMWKYAKDYVKENDPLAYGCLFSYNNIDPNSYVPKDHRVQVLFDYLKYTLSINMNPETNSNAIPIYKDASPINFVRNIQVPTYLIHGIDDQIVPVNQSFELYRKMKSLDKDVNLNIVWGEGMHAPIAEMFTELPDFVGLVQTIAIISKILKNHLG